MGKALDHGAATLETIDALDADVEELRTRAAAPDIIVGDKIPIEDLLRVSHIERSCAPTDHVLSATLH